MTVENEINSKEVPTAPGRMSNQRRLRWLLLAILVAAAVVVGVLSIGGGKSIKAGSQETPRTFVAKFFKALNNGDWQYLDARLNSVVTAAYGAGQCRSYLSKLPYTQFVYKIESIGKPGPIVYSTPGGAAGSSSTVSAVAVTVKERRINSTHSLWTERVIHVALDRSGHYTWFLRSCGHGTATTSSLAKFDGNYIGHWHNSTFGSNGPASIHINVNGNGAPGSAVTVGVTLGGNVFGGVAPAPLTLTGVVVGTQIAASSRSPFFGKLTWKIDSSGALTASGSVVPGGRVITFNATGSIMNGQMLLSYSVSLFGGTVAKGTVSAHS